MDLPTIQSFLTALLIGALVGIERERSKGARLGGTPGGMRTFILLAELGAVAAWLGQQHGNAWLFPIAILLVTLLVSISYVLQNRDHGPAIGITTEVAAVLVCLLGGMVMLGHMALAVALGIVTSALLAFKQTLHEAAGKLAPDDFFAGLKLLIASFVVLPLLPNYPLDPWQALNPYKLWLLVILISSLSLIGYIAVRRLGNTYGTAITGLMGGLVSSTAVSLAFARDSRLRSSPQVADALAAGMLLAWAVMSVRVLVLVLIIEPALLSDLLVPSLAMLLATLIPTGYIYWHSTREAAEHHARGDIELKNPFSLVSAMRFGLFFALVLLSVAFLRQHATAESMLALGAFAGLADLDAITLSMASHAGQGGSLHVAALTIIAAMLSNTLVKWALTLVLGSNALRYRISFATALILATGGVSLFF